MATRTTLNAEMLVVVGPMGRDVAAFSHWLDAFGFASKIEGAHYRRPDGETISARSLGAAEVQAWATSWAGNDAAPRETPLLLFWRSLNEQNAAAGLPALTYGDARALFAKATDGAAFAARTKEG